MTDYDRHPGLEAMNNTEKRNIILALERVLRAAQSESIGRRRSMANFPAVVDLHSHSESLNMGMGVSPCLTKGKSGRQAFYSLHHARRLSVEEMCRLQGLDSSMMTINVTDRQIGSLLGSGSTCTVMARVLVSAIQAEERSRADTGAPAATGALAATNAANRKYAYDTPAHQEPPYLKRPAIVCIKTRPARGPIKLGPCGQPRTAPVRQEPPSKRRSLMVAANGLTGGHHL